MLLRDARDLVYPDIAAALCALVDNAIDARASEIDLILETADGHLKAIAVADNGIGMIPEMMRAACAAGASCLVGDGPHLARGGFGLPSAPLAIGRGFDLYSRSAGSALQRLHLDCDELSMAGAIISEPKPAEPLAIAGLAKDRPGTIILIQRLHPLRRNGIAALRTRLIARLGYVFGCFLSRINIRVDGLAVPTIDPLFLTPDAIGYDLDGLRAEDCGSLVVPIGDAAATIRLSFLPPGFAPARPRTNLPGSANPRSAVVRHCNGLIVSRLGRRIALLSETPVAVFTGDDRMVKAELDFPPDLDDRFGPSRSLHQLQVAPQVWSALRSAGLPRRLDLLRRRAREQRLQRRGSEEGVSAPVPLSPRRASLPQQQG